LAIFTGLRCGDIRNLRLSDINWERKTINIVMSKTGKPLELPLSEEVGWSIIDYLKNGRPDTKSDHVFVKHKRPFDCIGSHASLDQPLSNYMLKAGIAVKRGERYGLHSLRNTLAKNMLITGAPIVTISQVLGHEDPRTTELYLKTNVDELRFCALDPDEGMVEL
jgi:integrase